MISAEQQATHCRRHDYIADGIFARIVVVQHKSTTQTACIHTFRLHFHLIDVCFCIHQWIFCQFGNDLRTKVSHLSRF